MVVGVVNGTLAMGWETQLCASHRWTSILL